MAKNKTTPKYDATKSLLFAFCRLQFPDIMVATDLLGQHLSRTFELYRSKTTDKQTSWPSYLETLYPLDWFLACDCMERNAAAWEHLFAARANRVDFLLVDALRARALRLYPGNEERQENAVAEFWSHLLVSDGPTSLPVLARYDGQRPLVPWLIRVFQNWHISLLRQRTGTQPLPEDDVGISLPTEDDGRWHETFCSAARQFIGELSERELLVLGLRLRYRMSQRDVARIVGVHEGTISRLTSDLRDRCLNYIGQRLTAEGWSGDDLSSYVLTEMENVLMDEPRLSADNLAALLARLGAE